MKSETDIDDELFEAVCSGDVEKIQTIIATRPNILQKEWPGGGGAGYLHLAASEGQTLVCRALVELGININTPIPKSNRVPLEEAASSGHLETVKWLLKNGAKVDGLPNSAATPLMAAAIEGHIDVVRLLLDNGAEINREHLRMPQTALDYAEVYRVKQSGQDAVAELLRERGGIRPYYAAPHDWNGFPGQLYIEHVERAIGAFINPIPLAETELATGEKITIRRIRIPTKWDYQLLFTVGLAFSGSELALCLPSAWPLNSATLKDPRYAWPVDLLFKLGEAVVKGARLSHGDLLDHVHPALEDFNWPEKIRQWVVVLNQTMEAERGDDTSMPQTLFPVPILTKKCLSPGPEAQAKADKLQNSKWKVFALPLDI